MVHVVRKITEMTRPSLEKRIQVVKENVGIHATLRCVLLCARTMGFLPVSGLTRDKGRDVR